MGSKTIWFHAVSVGEVRAVVPMLSLIQAEARSRDRVVLSTVTVTGQETARRECGFVSSIFHFPLDLPFVVGRALKRINPEVFITAETEIWPNFFAACFKRKIPVIVVNGRISDSSFSRYFRFRWFFRPILEQVSLFLMQSGEDASRIVDIGARPETVKVTGNMKYDRIPEPVSLPEEVELWAKGGFLLVAGSTHADEEEMILDSIDGVEGNPIRLALVPRHPERFNEVAMYLKKAEVPFTRYTDILEGVAVEGDVLLVDAMGVLEGFYALADVAFVGGSLVPVGGHNLLEPAAYDIPVLTGPHVHNFRDMAEAMIGSGGCWMVEGTMELRSRLLQLKKDPDLQKNMGKMVGSSAGNMRGASMKNFEVLKQILN